MKRRFHKLSHIVFLILVPFLLLIPSFLITHLLDSVIRSFRNYRAEQLFLETGVVRKVGYMNQIGQTVFIGLLTIFVLNFIFALISTRFIKSRGYRNYIVVLHVIIFLLFFIATRFLGFY